MPRGAIAYCKLPTAIARLKRPEKNSPHLKFKDIDNPPKSPFEKGDLVATLLCRAFFTIYRAVPRRLLPKPSGTRRKPAWSEGKGSERNQIQNSAFRIQNSRLIGVIGRIGRIGLIRISYYTYYTYHTYLTH